VLLASKSLGTRSTRRRGRSSSTRVPRLGLRRHRNWISGWPAVRIRLKGINRVRKRLATGTVKTYYYAWKGGPPLPGKPGTEEFVAAYNAAVASKISETKVAKSGNVLLKIIRDYQRSQEFLTTSGTTRRVYESSIRKIEKEFGDFPLSALRDEKSRAVFLEWRDKVAESSPSSADKHVGMLSRVLSWALGRRLVDANPCAKPGRLHHGTRVDKIWTEDQETAALTKLPEHFHLAVRLALWTGQRESDLVALRWSQYDGQSIRLEQQKSRRRGKAGKRVVIPVGTPLKAALDTAERHADAILVTSAMQPWADGQSFASAFYRARKKAGITGVTFHDFRGTAVTRLARAGCTVPEIASITGHSLKEVTTILQAHYLLLDEELASNAIRKLEMKTTFPTKLPTEQQRSVSVRS
jgi:integrase